MLVVRPKNMNGYPDNRYIHYTWNNFKTNVMHMSPLYKGNPPTADTYTRWADLASENFKNKFSVDPDLAMFYHDKFKELYNKDVWGDLFLNSIKKINMDFKQAGKGFRKNQYIAKALDGNLSIEKRREAAKKVEKYIKALEELLNAIKSIDPLAITTNVETKGGSAFKFDTAALQALKHNTTAVTSYVNIKNALNSLTKAIDDIEDGKSMGIIEFDKYSSSLNEMKEIILELIEPKKGQNRSGSIPVEKFTSALDGNIAHVMGEYMEYAVIDALSSAIDELQWVSSSGSSLDPTTGRKIKSDAVAKTQENITLRMSIKNVPHGKKVTYEQSSVGRLLQKWEENRIKDKEIFEFLLLNAVTHKVMGRDVFAKTTIEKEVYKMLEYMAALSANFIIGNDIDFVFYADAVYTKEEVFRGMAAMRKGFKRMSYTLDRASFTQKDIESWYNIGMAKRLSELHAKINSIGLLVDSK